MSTKSKLINNNQKLNSNNLKLMAIKNAFMRPLPQYNGSSTPTSGKDTSDATATQSDILLNKFLTVGVQLWWLKLKEKRGNRDGWFRS